MYEYYICFTAFTLRMNLKFAQFKEFFILLNNINLFT